MNELFPELVVTTLACEERLRRQGYVRIAGVDEAGRGPLAGPVVAAAVILPARCDLPGLTDSKQLSAAARERLLPLIRAQALAVGVGVADAAEIDRDNILRASLAAMGRAVARLPLAPDYLLVDGLHPVPLPLPQLPLVQGDARSLSIAAASVVAKVVRDRMMRGYAQRFPGYGFAGHKGYGSAAHREAIERLGPCAIHRRTFRGVREFLEDGE